MTPHLLTLCRGVVTTYDGRVPAPGQTIDGQPAPTGPHAILYGGTPAPASLNLTHDHRRTHHTWRIVCVSNTPHGARTIANLITRAIDSTQAPGHPHDRYTVTHASDPIEDRDDPTAWRWSTTVEVSLTTGR